MSSPTTPRRRHSSVVSDQTPRSPRTRRISNDSQHHYSASRRSSVRIAEPLSPTTASAASRLGHGDAHDAPSSPGVRNEGLAENKLGASSLADELASEFWEEEEGEEEGEEEPEELSLGNGGVSDIASSAISPSRWGQSLDGLNSADSDHEQESGVISTSIREPVASSSKSDDRDRPSTSHHSRQKPSIAKTLDRPSDRVISESEEDGDLMATSALLRTYTASDRLPEMLIGLSADFSAASATENTLVAAEERLRSLTSDAIVENHTKRYVSACSALTTHISRQSSLLGAIAHRLIVPSSSSFAVPPLSDPGAMADELIPLLSSLSMSLQAPSTEVAPFMRSLHASTHELVSLLSYLSDSLQIFKQTSTTAARRLRAARELAQDLRVEADKADEGVQWLSAGNWEERLRQREAAKLCYDVVDGFEQFCSSSRQSLIQSLNDIEVRA